MKVIIAGSRNIVDPRVLELAIAESEFDITEVVSGCARGADTLGAEWGEAHGVPVKMMPAQWDRYGKSAGYKRNVEMGQYADGLIALWDGVSRGTEHMIGYARSIGLKVHVHIVGKSLLEF